MSGEEIFDLYKYIKASGAAIRTLGAIRNVTDVRLKPDGSVSSFRTHGSNGKFSDVTLAIADALANKEITDE